MKRSHRAVIAAETLAICEAGRYKAPSGKQVDLADQLKYSRAQTELYNGTNMPVLRRRPGQQTTIEVTDETTVAAMMRLTQLQNVHVGCLNFASAKNPGGGFLGGAEAQEESLARASGLYPCLLAQPEYYEKNRANPCSLYLDQIIYSPLVPFLRDDTGALLERTFTASVLTSPAPNAGALGDNDPGKLSQVQSTLIRRAGMVLAVAAAGEITHLVLGAWGCGVFRNDPAMVAECFAALLREQASGVFQQVTFAVFDRTAERGVLRAFEKALAHWDELKPG